MATRLDTPERLMQYAAEGRLTKHVLSTLLTTKARREFLEACAALEKSYTDACAAATEPCLESGCSVEGETCLQPLLNLGNEYLKACGTEWRRLFADPRNRVSYWSIDLPEAQAEG